MKLTDVESRKLKRIASTSKGSFLMEYLEKIKSHVADVRNPINVKPEYENAVRVAVCEVIDELVIQRLKTLAEEPETARDEWR
jgi:hypothetical protein